MSTIIRVQLNGFGIIEDKLCKLCKKEPETSMHLLCECEIVILFWNSVSDWIWSRIAHQYLLDK